MPMTFVREQSDVTSQSGSEPPPGVYTGRSFTLRRASWPATIATDSIEPEAVEVGAVVDGL